MFITRAPDKMIDYF